MAITKIDDIHFYAAVTKDAQACWDMKNYLITNNIKFTNMLYDDTQLDGVLASLSTWWPGANFTGFPILVYTEVHDDLSVSQYPRVYFTDVASLSASNFLELYNLTSH